MEVDIITIDGIKIPQHTNVSMSNISNVNTYTTLNGKQSYVASIDDASKTVQFVNYLTIDQIDEGLADIQEALVRKSKVTPLPVTVGRLTQFNGVITEYSVLDDEIHGIYEYSWTITEMEEMPTTKTEFRSMNYVVPSVEVNTPSTVTNTNPSYYKNIIKKTLTANCNRIQTNARSLQKYLRGKGYYTGIIDGVYCTLTTGAVKLWQRKYTVTVTGKWDNKSIAQFKKLYKM